MDRPDEERSYSIVDGGVSEAAHAIRILRRPRVSSEAGLLKLLEKTTKRTHPVLVFSIREVSS